MHIVELNMYQATGVAAVMLVIGQFLVNRIELLRRYCIPAPVVGGFLFAILHTILRGAGIIEFNMDTTLQTVFMTAFFCSVGYTAAFSMLKKGGINVIKFLILAILIVIIQDALGAGAAGLFGLDARLGLAMGSIPLVSRRLTRCSGKSVRIQPRRRLTQLPSNSNASSASLRGEDGTAGILPASR